MSINYLARWNCGSLCMNQIHEHAALVSILDILYMLDNKVGTWAHPSHSKENVICKEVRCQSLHTTPKWKSEFSLNRDAAHVRMQGIDTTRSHARVKASEVPTNQNFLHLKHYKHSKSLIQHNKCIIAEVKKIFKFHQDTSHPSTKININIQTCTDKTSYNSWNFKTQ